MDIWKMPPDVKIYEAFGSIGDDRVEILDDGARVRSSSGGKIYDVRYDRLSGSIMANDNGSYWQGYIGYPAIAYLMLSGEIDYDDYAAQSLAGFDWKRINTTNKNDWAKTIARVKLEMAARNPGVDLDRIDRAVSSVRSSLAGMHLSKLGPRVRPPAGN